MSTPEYDAHVHTGVDLGGDHWVHLDYRLPDGRQVGYPADQEPPDGSIFIGLLESHRNAAGEWCGGWIGFSNVVDPVEDWHSRNSRHELVSADPLTVTPSLACRRCPNHGYIRAGSWVDA